MLKALDDLGMADGTIVIYSTDNGPHMNSWPDAAMTPFRNEKNSNWEGDFRVPAMVRWPGHIKPGTISTDIVSHLDWAPALLAAASVPDVKEQFLETFQQFPSNQKARSFGIDQVMEQLKSGAAASA